MTRRWVARHRLGLMEFAGGYTSPYLLEILSTRSGAPGWASATGTLTANTGQVVSCSRASSAYCWDGTKLVLLGANTVRVEPTGLLCEGASTNYTHGSCAIGDANWNIIGATFAAPVVTLNSTDVTDPAGGNAASKVVFPACSGGGGMSIIQSASGTPGYVGRTHSLYARTLSGTANINISNQNGLWSALTITDTWQRFTLYIPSGETSPWFDLGYINFGAGDPDITGGTVYLWGAQTEPFPFATSLMVTTNSDASRDMDTVYVSNPLSGLSPATFKYGGTFKPQNTWQGNVAGILYDVQGFAGIGAYGVDFPDVAFYGSFTYGPGAVYLDGFDAVMNEQYWAASPTLANDRAPHSFISSNDNVGLTSEFFVDGVSLGTGVAVDNRPQASNVYVGNMGGRPSMCNVTDFYLDSP